MDLCSALSFLIDVADYRSILKNYRNTYPRFIFYPKEEHTITGVSYLQRILMHSKKCFLFRVVLYLFWELKRNKSVIRLFLNV